MGKSTAAKLQKFEDAEKKIMSAFSRHNVEAVNEVFSKPLYTALYPYMDSFLKNPASYNVKTKSTNLDKQLIEMVRHAFGKYQVCKALTSVWTLAETPTRNGHGHVVQYEGEHFFALGPNKLNQNTRLTLYPKIDFRHWYICVAAGGSLYKQHAKEMLTKKEVHILTNCTHDMHVHQALVYSIAKAECEDEGTALRISHSKLKEKAMIGFWATVVRFFAKNPVDSLSEINDLCDYLQSRADIDAREMANRSVLAQKNYVCFTMSGQTIPVLKKKMQDWHWELRRAKVMGNTTWEGMYLPDEVIKTTVNNKEVDWVFHQIKNAKALAAEGSRMRHCVYSYRDRCASGNLSIWSLAKTNEFGYPTPKITLELNNRGEIVQARGVANRNVKPEEYNVISKWARDHDLYISTYVRTG